MHWRTGTACPQIRRERMHQSGNGRDACTADGWPDLAAHYASTSLPTTAGGAVRRNSVNILGAADASSADIGSEQS